MCHDFLETFLSHSAKKIRRGTFLCFRKFLVSKNYMDKGGVGITIFRRINQVKKCRSRLGFEPIANALEPCCPTHWAMGAIGISD